VNEERSTVHKDGFTVDEPALRPVNARRIGGRKGETEDEPVDNKHQRRAPDVRRRARTTDGGLETVGVGFHCERKDSVLWNAEKGEVKGDALFLSLIPYSLTVPGALIPVTNHPCNSIIFVKTFIDGGRNDEKGGLDEPAQSGSPARRCRGSRERGGR
jgi:hypothetical protein